MNEIKEKVKATIKSIDTEKLSLNDLSLYLDICNKMKTLDSKDYSDILSAMSLGFNSNAGTTIKDLQVDKEEK